MSAPDDLTGGSAQHFEAEAFLQAFAEYKEVGEILPEFTPFRALAILVSTTQDGRGNSGLIDASYGELDGIANILAATLVRVRELEARNAPEEPCTECGEPCPPDGDGAHYCGDCVLHGACMDRNRLSAEVKQLRAELAQANARVRELEAERNDDRAVHDIGKSFHDLACKERDHERTVNERLRTELAARDAERVAIMAAIGGDVHNACDVLRRVEVST